MIAGVMLLLAILPVWPYGYYLLLRLVVCAVGVYAAWYANKHRRPGWIWTMVLIAILFNPVLPVHLSKGVWVVLDLVIAVVFFVFSRITKRVANGANLSQGSEA